MKEIADRTRLAWERSALGPLATAALLLGRHLEPALGRALLALADVALALALLGSGRARSQRIRAVDAPGDRRAAVPAGGRQIAGAGIATAATALATAVLIALGT